MNKLILLLLLVVLPGYLPLNAQSKKGKNQTGKYDDSLNKVDKWDKKQGTWFYKVDALRGEPAYMTFGNYVDDKREGIWYKIDAQGQLISIENYNKGLLDKTAQYFENGRLTCIGNYKSFDQTGNLDSIWVTNPITLYDTLVAVPAEKGFVKHGNWRYYDPISGQLVLEQIYQMDDLIRTKAFPLLTKSDSTLIRKRVESLPHNQYKADKKKQQANSSPLYPQQLKRKK